MKPLLSQLRANADSCVRGMQVSLPGGLLTGDELERSVAFHTFTGFIEQKLLQSSESRSNQPGYVTEVLSTAIERIGERQPDREAVASLCVADRQFLMIQLSRLLEGDQQWLSHICKYCSSEFDVPIDRSALPVKEAGSTFPKACVQLHEKILELRVPTGLSQERIAELDDKNAMYALLSSCLISVDGEVAEEDYIKGLADSDIALIEDALEQASPEVATSVTVNCPECQHEQAMPFDAYVTSEASTSTLYHEIHSLALHYHWSEAEILALPSDRRHLYLGMIDRAQGMHR